MNGKVWGYVGPAVMVLTGLVLVVFEFRDVVWHALEASSLALVGVALILAGAVWWAVRAGPRDPGTPRASRDPERVPVGLPWLVLSLVYLAGGVSLIMYLLLAVWPRPTPANVPPVPDRPQEQEAVEGGDTAFAELQRQVDSLIASNRALTTREDSMRLLLDGETRPLTCGDTTTTARLVSDDGLLDPSCVAFWWGEHTVFAEQRLLIIVFLAGGLGGLLHGLRSIVWYIGNRSLYASWLATYLMLPFTGGAVAFVFYVVVRGGFFSPTASFSETSPFGFAAMATLVGLFSGQAILKLKQLAETLLTRTERGADHEPATGASLMEITLTPDKVEQGADRKLTVKGEKFPGGAKVVVGTRPLDPTARTPAELEVLVPAELLKDPGTLQVYVADAEDTRVSKYRTLTVTAKP